ncbi:hypothetical protein Tsubulata_012007 [Turnera subulata]|uniref:Anaphase-promoting complex subunit 4 WD40 domain-containing protein n=1 Tax=Turnera subulata TaxID=218843 RepID=A0A9Q0FDF8_9ROSI|nr:hypothetical protein Tsubulata_012007 [Turnera subulata]
MKGKRGFFLDDYDSFDEYILGDEDLPDADDDDKASLCSDEEDYSDDDDYLRGSDDEFLEEAPEDDSVHVFTGHTEEEEEDELYAIACSPTDNTLVATGGSDEKGILWRIGPGDPVVELRHQDSVSCLAFSNDGQLLASGGLDASVRIWDAAGNHKHDLKGNRGASEFEIEWVRWHPRGHLVLAGSCDSDCTARLWNADTGVLLNTFCGHSGAVTCGDFTPDGKTICTGSTDATQRIWNPVTGETVHLFGGDSYHAYGLTCLAISSDSTLAITGAMDGSVNAVNITTGKASSPVHVSFLIEFVLYVWWVQVVSSLSAHSDSIRCIGLASRFPWAATGSKDRKLTIWDLQHLSPRSSCMHEAGVRCVAWFGVSGYLATGCSNGKILLWDGRSGEHIRTLTGHTGCIQSLSVSANEDFLVSASYDGTARVFQISEFK